MRTVSGVTLRPDESEDKTFKKSLFYTFALVEPILPFLPKNISISLRKKLPPTLFLFIPDKARLALDPLLKINIFFKL